MDYGEKMKKQYQDYIQGLEEERRKIQVFERELPLCLDLVNQAIANCKQQLNLSECEEQQQTSTESPVLEQFIPLKRSLSSEEEENESAKKKQSNEKKGEVVDWMRSVQLWNPTPDPCSKSDLTLPAKIENKKSGGAFHPFLKDKSKKTSTAVVASSSSMPVPMAAATSSTGDNSNKSREDGEGQRKARRCWSPELHRRFLQALQQLGGSHAATPKQIRELMKVDGLTNDEVKSHLQKYRLHTRRPAGSIHSSGNTQPTQFVLVGGIWVQPPEYSVTPATNGDATTTGTAPNGIYVPVATAPPRQETTTCSQQPQQQQLQQVSPPGSSRRSSHSVGDDNTHSDSREATSSSSDTTTASPAS